MPLIITLSDLLAGGGDVRSTVSRSNFADMHPEIHLADALITAGMAIRSPRDKQYGGLYRVSCPLSNSRTWHMLEVRRYPHAVWPMSPHDTARFLAFSTDG